ncbi:hypothetical protein BGZ94_006118, partial [Podila epigama]
MSVHGLKKIPLLPSEGGMPQQVDYAAIGLLAKALAGLEQLTFDFKTQDQDDTSILRRFALSYFDFKYEFERHLTAVLTAPLFEKQAHEYMRSALKKLSCKQEFVTEAAKIPAAERSWASTTKILDKVMRMENLQLNLAKILVNFDRSSVDSTKTFCQNVRSLWQAAGLPDDQCSLMVLLILQQMTEA